MDIRFAAVHHGVIHFEHIFEMVSVTLNLMNALVYIFS